MSEVHCPTHGRGPRLFYDATMPCRRCVADGYAVVPGVSASSVRQDMDAMGVRA